MYADTHSVVKCVSSSGIVEQSERVILMPSECVKDGTDLSIYYRRVYSIQTFRLASIAYMISVIMLQLFVVDLMKIEHGVLNTGNVST